MNRIRHMLIVLAGMICALPALCGTVDFEGYPVFYLRGNMDNNEWAADSRYLFTRDGDSYTLKVATLDGEFKVSDDDWAVNFGAEGAQTLTISPNTVVDGVQDGANYKAVNLTDVTVSFTYQAGAPTRISFVSEGGNINIEGLSGTLPVLYINVLNADGSYNNEVIDKDLSHKNYFKGEYWLDLNGCKWLEAEGAASIGSATEPLPLEIKARGNYTRKAFAKKPFKLKLGAKQKMLGLSKSKHFAILAHADDNFGYMRNFTGFNLGRRIGLPWTPWQQPVEVVINGDYRGLYFLTESIRVGDGRVPIEELDDNVSDPELVSGGYLVELDNYDETNQIQLVEKGQAEGYKDMLRVTFDTPEEYSELQLRFITDQFTAMNDLIGENSDALWSYMDMDDAARYYLVEEIISHVEAYHGSTYLFRDRGEGRKWHFSPLWDCGNAFNGPTDDFFYRHTPFGATWIPSLRLNDTFNEKVRQTWMWFMSNGFEGIYNDIDEYVAHISEAAKADARRWRDRPVPDGGMSVSDNSDMESRRNRVLSHLQYKVNWLKGAFGDYTGAVYPEPERDATPAAPLPDYARSGVEDVAVSPAEGTVEYFNLQGQPVAAPVSGGMYIVRRGSVVAKGVIR